MNTAGHSPLFWTYARAFLGQISSDPAEPATRLAGALQIRFEVLGFVTSASRTAKNIQLKGTCPLRPLIALNYQSTMGRRR